MKFLLQSFFTFESQISILQLFSNRLSKLSPYTIFSINMNILLGVFMTFYFFLLKIRKNEKIEYILQENSSIISSTVLYLSPKL